MSDEKRDRAVLLITAFIGVGAFVVLMGLNALSMTGIFGADCGLIPTNRTARCYQAGFPNNLPVQYYPTSGWHPDHMDIIFPTATPGAPSPLMQ